MSNSQLTPTGRFSLWIGAVVVSLLASVFVVVLFEGALRIWWPQQERVVRGRAGNFGVPDPEIGWVYRPGAWAVVRGPEFSAEYRIGPEGLRDETAHAIPKPPHVFRVLLVGDSFTFGIGSNYEDTWPVVLERQLAARALSVEIVKAGVWGQDTRAELLMMRRLVPKYQPDVVLLTFLPNDLFTNSPLGRVDPAGNGQMRPHRFGLHTIDLLQRILFRNDSVYARLYLITARRQYFVEPPSSYVAGQYAVTKDLLAQAKDYAGSQHSRFAVLSIPQSFQVLVKANGLHFPGIDVDAVDRKLGSYAAGLGFPWLAVMEKMVSEYAGNRRDLYHRLDGHLTPLGNRIVGEWMTEQLVRIYRENPRRAKAAHSAGT